MMNFTSCLVDAPVQLRIVAVEGNIAAGKTTLLEQLVGEPRRLAQLLFEDKTVYDYAIVVPEPIDRWTSVGSEGIDLLGAMYTDPQTYGMACQMNIVNTQLDAIVEALRRDVVGVRNAQPLGEWRSTLNVLIITERSTLSGKEVFARAMLEKKRMSTAHWAVYEHSFRAAHALFREQVAQLFDGAVELRQLGTVLLQITPESALKRAEKRGRTAEAGLPLAVYEELDRRHREVFALRANKLVGHEIVAVDSATLLAVLRGKVAESVLQLAVMARKKAALPAAAPAVE